jgi:hypothetical protein
MTPGISVFFRMQVPEEGSGINDRFLERAFAKTQHLWIHLMPGCPSEVRMRLEKDWCIRKDRETMMDLLKCDSEVPSTRKPYRIQIPTVALRWFGRRYLRNGMFEHQLWATQLDLVEVTRRGCLGDAVESEKGSVNLITSFPSCASALLGTQQCRGLPIRVGGALVERRVFEGGLING